LAVTIVLYFHRLPANATLDVTYRNSPLDECYYCG
jgi:hypothetical protein